MNLWSLLGLSLMILLLPSFARPRGEIHPELDLPRQFLWWINSWYCTTWHHLEVIRLGSLPMRGPAILIANHTCGADPFLLQSATRRVLGFLIAQEFHDWPIARPMCLLLGCIPVKRDGRDFHATRESLRALERGRVLVLFPGGRIVPTAGHDLGEFKPGAAFLALRSGAVVYPSYLSGTPPTRSIARAIFSPSRARIVIGPALDLTAFHGPSWDARENLELTTAAMRGAIEQLQTAYPPEVARPSIAPTT